MDPLRLLFTSVEGSAPDYFLVPGLTENSHLSALVKIVFGLSQESGAPFCAFLTGDAASAELHELWLYLHLL